MVLTFNAGATIYQWTNEKGITVYSDQYRQGAKEVKLNPIQSLSGKEKETPPAAVQSTTPKFEYKTLTMLEPTPAQYIRDNQGIVQVKSSIEPDLQGDDSIQPLLDGKPFGTPQRAVAFSLTEVPRGEHTLQLQLQDKDGNSLLDSNSVTFFIQRHFTPPSP